MRIFKINDRKKLWNEIFVYLVLAIRFSFMDYASIIFIYIIQHEVIKSLSVPHGFPSDLFFFFLNKLILPLSTTMKIDKDYCVTERKTANRIMKCVQ